MAGASAEGRVRWSAAAVLVAVLVVWTTPAGGAATPQVAPAVEVPCQPGLLTESVGELSVWSVDGVRRPLAGARQDGTTSLAPDGATVVFQEQGVWASWWLAAADGSWYHHLGSSWPRAWSPDGSRLLVQDSAAPAGADRFRILDRTGAELLAFGAQLGWPASQTWGGQWFRSDPQWSPDGRHVAWVVADGAIVVVDVDDGTAAVHPAPDGASKPVGLSWSSDGSALAWPTRALGSVWTLDIATGAAVPVPQLDGFAAWSPHDDRLAGVVVPDSGNDDRFLAAAGVPGSSEGWAGVPVVGDWRHVGGWGDTSSPDPKEWYWDGVRSVVTFAWSPTGPRVRAMVTTSGTMSRDGWGVTWTDRSVVAWAPSGQWAAAWTSWTRWPGEDHRLVNELAVDDGSGGTPTVLDTNWWYDLEEHISPVRVGEPAWSPVSDRLAWSRNGAETEPGAPDRPTGVWVWEPSVGSVAVPLPPGELAWSPDGELLASATQSTLSVFDGSASMSWTVPNQRWPWRPRWVRCGPVGERPPLLTALAVAPAATTVDVPATLHPVVTTPGTPPLPDPIHGVVAVLDGSGAVLVESPFQAGGEVDVPTSTTGVRPLEFRIDGDGLVSSSAATYVVVTRQHWAGCTDVADLPVDDASLWSCVADVAYGDVDGVHPFGEAIGALTDAGVVGAYPDGGFHPGAVVTRQAAAAWLYRLAGSPEGEDPSCDAAAFPDVPAAHPFCGEIAWMVDEGLTSPYPDGGFHPGAAVSRQALVAWLWRRAGEPAADPGAPSFVDVPVGHPFHDAVTWAAGEGIVTGYGDGTFRPTNPVTRQAGAAFLWRARWSGET